MITLTIISDTVTHRSTHATVCRALAAYDMLEPEAIDLVSAHYTLASAGHYLGRSSRGSIVTFTRNLH